MTSVVSSYSAFHPRPLPQLSDFVPQDERTELARSGDEDFLDKVIMAVDIREHGKVGCAYYIAGEERLLCMEEVVGGGTDTMDKR